MIAIKVNSTTLTDHAQRRGAKTVALKGNPHIILQKQKCMQLKASLFEWNAFHST